jgi:hypothetical protein
MPDNLHPDRFPTWGMPDWAAACICGKPLGPGQELCDDCLAKYEPEEEPDISGPLTMMLGAGGPLLRQDEPPPGPGGDTGGDA